MKKRRELDALIGNRSKRDGGNDRIEYDSLTSSLSSPTPDIYIPPGGSYYELTNRMTGNPGKGYGCTVRRMIRICLPVCFLTLVAACITSCIGIVWMQVQLKTDIEKLNNRVSKLEKWQNDQPSALNDMKRTVSEMDLEMNALKSGESGVKNLAARLAKLTENFEEQIKVPSQKLDQLQSENNEFRSAVRDLKSSVGVLKSTGEEQKASQGLLTASFGKIQEKVDEIRNSVSEANVKQLTDLASSKQNAEERIIKLNFTLHEVSSNMTALQAKVASLEKRQSASEDLMKNVGPITKTLQQDVASLKQDGTQLSHNLLNISKDVSQVKRMIIGMTNNGNPPNKVEHAFPNQKPAEKSAPPPQKTLSTKQRQPITLSQVLPDVLKNFEALDKNKDGRLSQDELMSTYGNEAALVLLRHDKDSLLSKVEVSSAISAISSGTNR